MKLILTLGAAICILTATAAPQVLSAQAAKAGSVASDWYQFRGPKRDGLSPDTGLLPQWPAGGPPLAWKATGLGKGYSSVAVAANRIYTMGEANGAAVLIALNAADGKLLWKAPVGDTGDPGNQGSGPRCTPATDGVLVFGMGQQGTLVCVQAATGREVWRAKMSSFGGSAPGWGYSESPLLDGALVLVTPGGSGGSVVALNKTNGGKVWQSAQVKEPAQYTSITPIEMGKVPMYMVFHMKGVAGLMAKTGQMVWRVDFPGQTAIASAPVYKDGVLFASAGYGVGCKGYQVTLAGAQVTTKEIYEEKSLTSHHGGVILVGDHVYAAFDTGLKCVDLKTGKIAWQGSVAKGSISYAEGHLYCHSERGDVVLVEASPTAFKEKGRFTIPEALAGKSWAHPVVFGGRLYLREQDNLFAYNLKAAK